MAAASNGSKVDTSGWNHDMDDGPTIVTDIRTESRLYTWTVANWSACIAGARTSQYVLMTPVLKAPMGLEIQFGVLPSPQNVNVAQLYVNLLKGPAQTVRINFEVAAFDHLSQPFTKVQSQWGGCRCMSVPVNQANLYILNEPPEGQELTFRIKVTLADQLIHQTYDACSDAMAPGKELCDSNVRGDIARLLGDTNWSDVMLKIDDNHTYPAHRVVLAARSPVFAAMFRTDSQFTESRQQIVPIHDVQPQAMPYILEYLYTGSISAAAVADDLQVTYRALLIATDKYDMPGLKRLCEEALATRQLCEDNVCELLLLADRHSATCLKRKCIEYVKKHADAVAQSERWRELAAENSSLFSDLTSELLKGMGLFKKKTS